MKAPFWTNLLEALHQWTGTVMPKDISPGHKIKEALVTHDIARIIQVVGEDPGFSAWFLHLRSLPPETRIPELAKMAESFRSDPANEDIAAILDNLKSPPIYEAFCLALQETRALKHA